MKKRKKVRVPCPTMACDKGLIRWLKFPRYTKCKTCKGQGWIMKEAALPTPSGEES